MVVHLSETPFIMNRNNHIHFIIVLNFFFFQTNLESHSGIFVWQKSSGIHKKFNHFADVFSDIIDLNFNVIPRNYRSIFCNVVIESNGLFTLK